MLPRIQLCARECTACPVFEVTEDGKVAVYDSEQPGVRVLFSPQDIQQIIDAAVSGRLYQFTVGVPQDDRLAVLA